MKTKIEEIVDAASTLYRSGTGFKEAVTQALRQHRVSQDDWGALYRETCRRLGERGGKQAALLAGKRHSSPSPSLPGDRISIHDRGPERIKRLPGLFMHIVIAMQRSAAPFDKKGDCMMQPPKL